MINEFKIVPSAKDIGKAIKEKEIVKALALITLKSLSFFALLLTLEERKVHKKTN